VTEDLDRAIEAVVRRCLVVAPEEEVLVVCNPLTEGLGTWCGSSPRERAADATLR